MAMLWRHPVPIMAIRHIVSSKWGGLDESLPERLRLVADLLTEKSELPTQVGGA
jgi:hypothetical protein